MHEHEPTPRHRRRNLGAAVAAVAVTALLAACGVSGSDSSDAPPTTEQGDAATTTTDGGASPTTEAEDPDPGTVLSVEDLEAVLPEADEIGFGFDEVPGGDGESDSTASDAMSETCPETAEFLDEDDDGDDTASRVFAAADGRSFTVDLNPEPEDVDADYIAGMIDAVNGCGEFSFTASNGAEYTVVMSAERADEVGDMGVRIQQDITLVHPSLPEPVSFSQANWNFIDRTVGVELFSADGIANDGTVTPADHEILADVGLMISTELQPLFED